VNAEGGINGDASRPGWVTRIAVVVTVLSAVGLLSACRPLLPAPKATAVITATADPARFVAGSTVTISVALTPDLPGAAVPTGNLLVGNGTAFPLTDGRASYSTVVNVVGTFTIPFDYSGDDQYLPGSGTVTFISDMGMAPFTGSGPTVAMAGDSITYFSKETMDRGLSAAGYRHSITGLPGYTAASAQWLVDDYAAAAPDVFVFALGTNDMTEVALGLNGTTLASIEARATAVAAQFPGACFVATTLSAHRSAAWQPPFAEYNAAADAYNDWVRATFPQVVDWDAAVAASIAAGTTILADEVHPTPAGQVVLGDLVRSAADGCRAPG